MAWLPSVLVPRCRTASQEWQRWRGHMVHARSNRLFFALLMISAWEQRRRSRREGWFMFFNHTRGPSSNPV